MTNKNIIITVSIILILGVVYLKQKSSIPPKNIGGGYIKILSGDFNPDEIRKIRFFATEKEDSGVVLEKAADAEEWMIPTLFNVKGDKQLISNLLNDLKELEGEERASSKEVFNDFGIADKEAFHFLIYGAEDKERYHLLVGKDGPSFSDGFIRFKDKEDIYLANKNLRSAFGVTGAGSDIKLDSKRWAEKRLIELDKDKIIKLIVNLSGKLFSVERKEKEIKEEKPAEGTDPKKVYEWLGIAPKFKEPLKNEQIDPLISLIINLRADDFADPLKIAEYGIPDSKTTVAITTEDNKEYKFYFGKKEEGRYYLLQEGKTFVYLLEEAKYKNIFDKAEELLKTSKKG